MALTSKVFTAIHNKTGSELTKLKNVHDAGHMNRIIDNPDDDEVLTAVMYQIQKMQDEIDYLRTEISSNKDKKGMTLGTSSTTALAGDTALLALGTSGSTALAGDTNIVTIGSSTTISFGDMITTVTGKPPKTTTTYSIVITVTKGGVTKKVTLILT